MWRCEQLSKTLLTVRLLALAYLTPQELQNLDLQVLKAIQKLEQLGQS